MIVQMVAPRVQLVDADGYMTREWYRLLAALYADSPSTREMAQQARRLADATLTASADIHYTAPAATRTVVRAAVLCNTTAGAINASIWLPLQGEGANATTAVLSNVSVAAGASRVCAELVDQVIEPGGTLRASGAGLTLVVSGVEYR